MLSSTHMKYHSEESRLFQSGTSALEDGLPQLSLNPTIPLNPAIKHGLNTLTLCPSTHSPAFQGMGPSD